MADKKLLARYGLKHNPFLPNLPVEALWRPPDVEDFIYRVESLLFDGGFALLSSMSGLGKSKTLQLIAHRLSQLDDVVVGVMERPQSMVSDLYRELGHLFGVDLSPANRYGGFKALRERWHTHINSTLFRPVLLVDEAQEMATCCLNELRLLSSVRFDSECILTIVLSGDDRLPDRFRRRELVPLGSRIRTRLLLEPRLREELLDFLDHLLEQAGAPHLVTDGLREVLVDHAAGNLRILTTMGAELLAVAAKQDLDQLDEKLFLELYSRRGTSKRGRAKERTA